MAGPGSNTMKMEADQKIADEALATSQQLRTSPDTKRVAQEIGTLASKRRQLARARLGLDEIPLRPPPPQGGIVISTKVGHPPARDELYRVIAIRIGGRKLSAAAPPSAGRFLLCLPLPTENDV